MATDHQSTDTISIPVSETYWSLVEKADKKFSKIRDLPYYERSRYNTYFYKVFKVYTKLWKFQQENRQKLVEAGVKRWEIGEIASRIAQLYYGQYMRTSDASYLTDAFVFYDAILSRDYFEGSIQNLHMANKQLRFLARFMMVCLVMNRRDKLHQLISLLKMMVDECKRTFQETECKEWKLVVQEIIRFLKADTTFMNTRPLRYSVVLDPDPDSLPRMPSKRKLRLRDAILSSYYHNEIKFSDMSLDTFRMLQCLEWEPSGSLYQPHIKIGQTDGQISNRVNYSHDIVDPTLPLNPRKAVLYRPSASNLLAVLGTICEELPSDGILLIYFSASARAGKNYPLAGTFPNSAENQLHPLNTGGPSFVSYCDVSWKQSKAEFLYFGTGGDGAINCIYPTDLIPFTRRPLFIIIDSDGSDAFKVISGSEKGEAAAILLSPSSSISPAAADSTRYQNGSFFTMFLTASLQAFCLLVGLSGSDIDMDAYEKAEKVLSSSMADWGAELASSDGLNPVWAQSIGDPFLRRLLLRFVFCRAALMLHGSCSGKEFHPECFPPLPASLSPSSESCHQAILKLSSIFCVANQFNFSEEFRLREMKVSEDATSAVA